MHISNRTLGSQIITCVESRSVGKRKNPKQVLQGHPRWRLHASSSWIARTMNSQIDLHVTCCVRSGQSNLPTRNRVEVWVRPIPRVSEVRLKWKHANSRTPPHSSTLISQFAQLWKLQESGREHVVTSKHWRTGFDDALTSTIVRSKSFVISRRLKMCSYDFVERWF